MNKKITLSSIGINDGISKLMATVRVNCTELRSASTPICSLSLRLLWRKIAKKYHLVGNILEVYSPSLLLTRSASARRGPSCNLDRPPRWPALRYGCGPLDGNLFLDEKTSWWQVFFMLKFFHLKVFHVKFFHVTFFHVKLSSQ